MSPYLLAGPAVALIGIVAVFFVMRHKSVQTRSMYSSRRSQIERKVKAARQRTLAPHGRGDKAPTDQEIAAGATGMSSAPAYQAPAYAPPAGAPSTPVWDSPAPTYAPPEPASPAYPSADAPQPPSAPSEPYSPAPAQPEWTTPAPSEPVWTPDPPPSSPSTPALVPVPAMTETAAASGSGGASWSIVGDARAPAEAPAEKGKKKQKRVGSAWELASGEAPGDEDDGEAKKPSAALAIAQYAVLVVGLVMVLIGVVVMVANTKGA